MPSFVCDRCQETLKKARLDSHFHRCNASFSCVDCSVSFKGTLYKAHTSCISEAEKYQKSLYVAPKGRGASPAPSAAHTAPAPFPCAALSGKGPEKRSRTHSGFSEALHACVQRIGASSGEGASLKEILDVAKGDSLLKPLKKDLLKRIRVSVDTKKGSISISLWAG